jgi:4a-hydroxytetrahydrobiopterin dehydratase
MTEANVERCLPCDGGVPSLKGEDLARRRGDLAEAWRIVDEHHLERDYRFRNFRSALAFTNVVGELAETLGHHPDISLGWGRVRLTIWTHKSGGLTDADFTLARQIDGLH